MLKTVNGVNPVENTGSASREKHSAEDVWRDIPGTNGAYQASTLGKIKSVGRWSVNSIGVRHRVYETVLTPCDQRGGYQHVVIKIDGKRKTIRIHTLIARTFLDQPDPSRWQINHKDGNKKNNRLENLEWVTPRENMTHALINGLQPKTSRKGKPVIQMTLDGQFVAEHRSARSCGYDNIYKVLRGKYKTVGGFTWKWKDAI